VHVYLVIFSISSDRYRCIRAVAFFSDDIEASVFGLYAQRSLSLHSGVGADTCISDVYRCFHVRVARTAIAIAASGRLSLSAMAIAACMLILSANDAYMPRVLWLK
jgi:succinate dehydrogenase hydrophobic anchor subunit